MKYENWIEFNQNCWFEGGSETFLISIYLAKVIWMMNFLDPFELQFLINI